MIIQWLD